MKLLYFHVPKTAGSSINKYFSANLPNHHFHIESVSKLDKDFCESYQFISGHVSYNRMDNILNLDEWITFATFREPLSYVISHLKWVRKLADASEKERFDAHPEIFQTIAMKMTNFDFSKSSEIVKFIDWLREINFYYFHNTQTHYMNQTKDQGFLSDNQVDKALQNMKKINFIGIQENLNEFMESISYEFDWKINTEDEIKVNTNENNYGFDISNPETQKALLPLYDKDLLIYNKAKQLFKKQLEMYSRKSVESIVGYLDHIDKNEARGWLRADNSLRKITLELQLDNITIQETTANIFRQDLKTKKKHPSGLCAFKFQYNNIDNIDNITIKVKDTNIILYRSHK